MLHLIIFKVPHFASHIKFCSVVGSRFSSWHSSTSPNEVIYAYLQLEDFFHKLVMLRFLLKEIRYESKLLCLQAIFVKGDCEITCDDLWPMQLFITHPPIPWNRYKIRYVQICTYIPKHVCGMYLIVLKISKVAFMHANLYNFRYTCVA